MKGIKEEMEAACSEHEQGRNKLTAPFITDLFIIQQKVIQLNNTTVPSAIAALSNLSVAPTALLTKPFTTGRLALCMVSDSKFTVD